MGRFALRMKTIQMTIDEALLATMDILSRNYVLLTSPEDGAPGLCAIDLDNVQTVQKIQIGSRLTPSQCGLMGSL